MQARLDKKLPGHSNSVEQQWLCKRFKAKTKALRHYDRHSPSTPRQHHIRPTEQVELHTT